MQGFEDHCLRLILNDFLNGLPTQILDKETAWGNSGYLFSRKHLRLGSLALTVQTFTCFLNAFMVCGCLFLTVY